MILNELMVDNLHEIRRRESRKVSKHLDVPANQLGNSLIDLYYSSNNLETRELITSFMNEAGVVWMRKLLTRDTGEVQSSKSRFASLADYIGLISSNDDLPAAEAI